MRRRGLLLGLAGSVAALPAAPRAAPGPGQPGPVQGRFFTTSDGVRLHYLEAGSRRERTVVFVPGWTMPGWIWERQIAAFSATSRVVAFDPRGQGESDVPSTGYDQNRRGRDIGELIATLGGGKVVVVAWSLGVLDTLAYVKASGDAALSGLVLVDNSIGEEPAPVAARPAPKGAVKPPHAVFMRKFVRAMFRTRQSEAWLDRLTQACLRTPEPAARALLAYPVPRTYWREAVYSTAKPILYVVRPRWAGQAENLVRKDKSAEMVLFPDAGHALFVDEPGRFNAVVRDFLNRRIGS